MKKFALLSMLLGLGLFGAGCDSKPAPKAKRAGGGTAIPPAGGDTDPAAGATGGAGMEADHEHAEGETHEGDEPKADGVTDPIEGDAGAEPKADGEGAAAGDEEAPK